jgi:hypothetical protein
MKVICGKLIIGLMVVESLFRFGDGSCAFAQAPKPKEGIVSASVSSSASVEIEIQASVKPLWISSCKGTDERFPYLCDARMERFDGKTWNRVKPGYPGEVFGVDMDTWRPTFVQLSRSASFVFTFNQDFYHVQKGERLRLLVPYFTSEESVKKEKSDGEFVSPAFTCP